MIEGKSYSPISIVENSMPAPVPANVKESTAVSIEIARIESVIDQPPILLIETQEADATRVLGSSDGYTEWFATAMGIPQERITTYNITKDPLPRVLGAYGGIIVGGSKFTAYDEYTGKDELEEFLRYASESGKPLWGVCFGHQVLNKALGGTVEKGENGREIGYATITLTDEGQNDPLFRGVGREFTVGTSHADVVTELPKRRDIVELANNENSPYQALSIGSQIRTTQFHPEMSTKVAKRLLEVRKNILVSEGVFDCHAAVFTGMREVERADIERAGQQIAHNFNEYFVFPNARGESL